MFSSLSLISMSSTFYHNFPRSPSTSSNSPLASAQLFGGETTSFSLWTALFSLFFYLYPLLLATQSIQCLYLLLYSLPELPDISGRAHSPFFMPWHAIC